jgi:hypothetical protein
MRFADTEVVRFLSINCAHHLSNLKESTILSDCYLYNKPHIFTILIKGYPPYYNFSGADGVYCFRLSNDERRRVLKQLKKELKEAYSKNDLIKNWPLVFLS